MHLQPLSFLFKCPRFDENDHSPPSYSTKPFFFHKYFCDGKSLKLRSSFHYSFHLISVEYIKSIGILSILEIEQDWVFTALPLSTYKIAKLKNKTKNTCRSPIWLRNISFFEKTFLLRVLIDLLRKCLEEVCQTPLCWAFHIVAWHIRSLYRETQGEI